MTPPLNRNQSEEFLNAFAITNADQIRWAARIYRFRPLRGAVEEQRRAIRDAVWAAKKVPGSACRRWSFVVDLDEEHVAVSADWQLAECTVNNFEVRLVETTEITATAPKWEPVFARILKDGLKLHFKDNASASLGLLWQDYNSFCETPTGKDDITENGFIFCRRYDFDAKSTRNGWALKFNISTSSIDARSIRHYYEHGEVHELKDRILAKLHKKSDRKGKAVAIRIWQSQNIDGRIQGKVYELANPSQILDDADLLPHEQKQRAPLHVTCHEYPKGQTQFDGNRCYLLLDSAITRDDHDETILDPAERASLALKLREFVNGCIVYGAKLQLAAAPVSANEFPHSRILPPTFYVKDQHRYARLGMVVNPTPEALYERGRQRQRYIQQFGFYESNQINPALAVPHFIGEERALDLQNQLNSVLSDWGITYRFAKPILYRNVGEIQKHVATGQHDALLAVLNQRWNEPQTDHDTHEQIKQMVPVPSQCIHHYNVFYKKYSHCSLRELQKVDQRTFRRIRNQLDLCITNLLVKCHWFPFLPAEPFHYGSRLAFDVGGKQNNQVMACLGLGFGNPAKGLIFKPEVIPLHSRQAEPVHPDALFNGFVRILEATASDMEADGARLEIPSLLIIRDGPLLGSGDEWNEKDALVRLHAEALRKGWCNKDAIWTAVELSKSAEGWRILSNNGTITNPTVGFSCFPFHDKNEGLICTTGLPYLRQGTAAPVKMRVIDIAGKAQPEVVAKDIIWEADMCFTKPDLGFSLPLTLRIADLGALQVSRRHKISGVTL
jgi:hypothetical protein